MSESRVIRHIVEKWANDGIVNAKEVEIYIFGINQLIWQAVNIITAVFIGLMFDLLWQVFVFELTYIPLRTYAGGFHARTPWACYLYSVVMIIVAVLLLKIPYWAFWICRALMLGASIIILLLAPIADKNKPITITEHKVYKRRTRVILLIDVVITMVFDYLEKIDVCACVVLAIVFLSGMLILAKVRKTGVNMTSG